MALIARPSRLRRRDLQLLAKIGLAAILAWWISDLLGADRPAFAAIVPLVALRADDPYGALGVSLFRVAGTVLGIRELMGMSRYSRSLLWSLLGDPVGDRIRPWPDEGATAFLDALRHADAAAGDVAEGRDPSAAIAAADGELERFASHAGGGEGARLAIDLHGGARAMIRVMKPETTARLRALALERYGPEGAR